MVSKEWAMEITSMEDSRVQVKFDGFNNILVYDAVTCRCKRLVIVLS